MGLRDIFKRKTTSKFLFDAVKKPDLNGVKKYLKKGGDVNALENSEGFTALIYAAARGHKDIARVLLDYRADLDVRDSYGYNALMYAVDGGYKEILRMLLDAGAAADLKNNSGTTALAIAVKKGREDIVQLLLDHGADMDSPNNDGITPRLLAARDRVIADIFEKTGMPQKRLILRHNTGNNL